MITASALYDSRDSSVALLKKALAVVESPGAVRYPSSETHWLFVTAWNLACELAACGDRVQAEQAASLSLQLGTHLDVQDAASLLHVRKAYGSLFGPDV